MIDRVHRIAAFNANSITAVAVLFGALYTASWAWLDGQPRWVSVAVTTALAALIVSHMRAAVVRIGAGELRVGAGLFRTRVSAGDIVGLSSNTDAVSIRWRKNGIGFPGYALGWFVAKDGRTVFAAAGKDDTRLRVRLSGRFDLLLGVVDRRALTLDLQAIAPQGVNDTSNEM